MDSLTTTIAVVAVIAAGISVVIGLIYAVMDLQTQADARAAAKKGAELSRQRTSGGFEQQADVAPAFEGLAKLAAALKDLDKSNRYFVLALGFLAVAGLSAGASDISDAIAGT